MNHKYVVATVMVLLVLVMSFGVAVAKDQPTIKILAFAQGFAWPELFGSKGTERTDLLQQLESEMDANIAIEWGDETAVRQKVLTDLIAGTGRYDIILVGTDGGIQSYGAGGFLEPLDEYFTKHPSKYFDTNDVFAKYLDANRMPPGGTLYALP